MYRLNPEIHFDTTETMLTDVKPRSTLAKQLVDSAYGESAFWQRTPNVLSPLVKDIKARSMVFLHICAFAENKSLVYKQG